MIKILSLRPAVVVICLAGLLGACQTTPQTYGEPRIEARDPGQYPRHRFWHANSNHQGMGWRNKDYQLQSFSACDNKVVGQSVTITLQNGRTIQGACTLQFRPYPPVESR